MDAVAKLRKEIRRREKIKAFTRVAGLLLATFLVGFLMRRLI